MSRVITKEEMASIWRRIRWTALAGVYSGYSVWNQRWFAVCGYAEERGLRDGAHLAGRAISAECRDARVAAWRHRNGGARAQVRNQVMSQWLADLARNPPPPTPLMREAMALYRSLPVGGAL